LAQEYPFLDRKIIHRLVRSYGTRARNWLATAKSLADLGRDFGHGLYQAEVDYLIACEWARCADDIVWRRSKLGLRLSAEQHAALDVYVSAKML
jgi:glycerol-3-phosphate dehydrogenase